MAILESEGDKYQTPEAVEVLIQQVTAQLALHPDHSSLDSLDSPSEAVVLPTGRGVTQPFGGPKSLKKSEATPARSKEGDSGGGR